ncbi:MAG: hypothetical protein ACJ72N_20030 [Labedaea sp.]
MSRARLAALLLTPLVLLGAAACRDDRSAKPPLTERPGASVEHQLDDLESALNDIESQVNDG